MLRIGKRPAAHLLRAASSPAQPIKVVTGSMRQPVSDLQREGLVEQLRQAEQRAAEHPVVDYLAMMEDAYGPKERWASHPDTLFLRRAVSVLCRKIDDLRERVAAAKARNKLARNDARKQVAMIPLLKREAWQSPDNVRMALLADLRGLGYIDGNGQLQLPDVEAQFVPASAPAALLTAAAPASSATADASAAAPAATATPAAAAVATTAAPAAAAAATPPVPEPTEPVVATPSGPPSVAPASALDWSAECPLVVDPMAAELHAPDSLVPGPDVLLLGRRPDEQRQRFNKLPSTRRIGDMLTELDKMAPDEGRSKVWAVFPHGQVECEVDNTGYVSSVRAAPESEHLYDDPRPRERGVRPPKAAAAASWEAAPHSDSEELPEEPAAAPSGDPVMARLRRQSALHRRRRPAMDLPLSILEGPVLKPPQQVNALTTQTREQYSEAPVAARLDAVERRLMSQEGELTEPAPTHPTHGPDAADQHLSVAANMSRDRILKLHEERARLRSQLRTPVVTGASEVSLLPAHPDQLPVRHATADAEGVWYEVTMDPAVPGKPVSQNRPWPRCGAVKVPFDVHKAARGRGYAAFRAREEIRRLTAQEPRYS